jgi:cell division protein ZapA
MATITLTIAGRPYELACRNGGEAHLRRIGEIVDAKAGDAARTMGGMSEARQMLFAALLLADELDDARNALAAQTEAPLPAPEPGMAVLIERLAERLERLATMLDGSVGSGVETPHASA